MVAHVVRGLGLERDIVRRLAHPITYGLLWGALLMLVIVLHGVSAEAFYYFRF